jgi:uncharacterized protein (DUF4415 family)
MRKSAAGQSTWVDPDDAPELTDDFFERAEIRENGVLIRVGRPKSDAPKRLVSIRLDPDVRAKLRADGPGWQTRINDIFRKALIG